jgi:hypothetical protein
MSIRPILGVCLSLFVAVAPAVGSRGCACVGTASGQRTPASCCCSLGEPDAASCCSDPDQPCERFAWTSCTCEHQDPQLSSASAEDTVQGEPKRDPLLTGARVLPRGDDRGSALPLELRPPGFRPLLL